MVLILVFWEKDRKCFKPICRDRSFNIYFLWISCIISLLSRLLYVCSLSTLNITSMLFKFVMCPACIEQKFFILIYLNPSHFLPFNMWGFSLSLPQYHSHSLIFSFISFLVFFFYTFTLNSCGILKL